MRIRNTLLQLLAGAGVLGLFLRCSNDTPVSSRFDLIGANEVGRVLQDTLQPPAVDSTAARTANTGASALLQLGTFNKTNSQILIRFSALPAGAAVRTAELLLPTHRVLESGADFEATVHRITSDWSEVDGDSVDGVRHDNFGQAFDPSVIGSQMVAAADSDTVRIALAPTLLNAWIDSSIANYGLLIQAPAAGTAKQFHSRHSSLRQPVLRLAYTKNNADSTKDIRAAGDAFIFEVLEPPPAGPLYISHGTDYRTLLKFDLSQLTPGATVNRAQLTLTIDRGNSRTTSDGMALQIYRVGKNTLDPLTAAEDSLSFVGAKESVTDSSTTVTFDIRSMVQSWLRGTNDQLRLQNYGLLMLARNANVDLQQLSFFSRETNPALAPVLTIDYTLPPSIQ